MQRVNHHCRAAVQNSTKLKQRLCIFDHSIKPLDVQSMDQEDVADIGWNPLLEWFSFRCFTTFGDFSQPLAEIGHLMVTTFLSHASNVTSASSVYQMSITREPDDTLRMCMPKERGNRWFSHTITVHDTRGVTVGDVLRSWKEDGTSRARGGIVSLLIPWQEFDDSTGLNTRITMGYAETLQNQHMAKLNFPPSVDPRLGTQLPRFSCRHSLSYHYEIRNRRWLHLTIDHGKEWSRLSKEEQGKYVLMYLQTELKHYVDDADLKRKLADVAWAHWPAFVLLKRNELYKVDYACGLVFNRQEVDAKSIRLPYK